MGIRDTSYYGWKDVSFAQLNFSPTGIAVDSQKQIYVCGYQSITSGSVWVVAKSVTGAPNTFTIVDFLYNYLSGTSGTIVPTSITTGPDDSIYVTGYETISSVNENHQWVTRKSISGNSGTFSTVDTYATPFNGYHIWFGGAANAPISICTSPLDGAVYVAGKNQSVSINWAGWYIRKSTTGASGTFNGVFGTTNIGNEDFPNQIAVNPVTGVVYCVGCTGHNSLSSIIYSSSTGNSGTWGVAESTTGALAAGIYNIGIAFNSQTGANYLHIFSQSGGGSTPGYSAIKSSSTGTPGSWVKLTTFGYGVPITNGGGGFNSPYGNYYGGINISSVDGKVFSFPQMTPSGAGINPSVFPLATSPTGLSGTYTFIDSYVSSPVWSTERNGILYICRYDANNNTVYRSGRLSSNSASLGPITFATSVGYVQSEISGVVTENFQLCNVSEWPHAGGLFQMKNMVLGTLSSGKIGNRDDSIIQVKHIGSTVQIMWPRQQNSDASIKGYGDLSAGQSIGKLTTIFDPGDFIDVTEFDHMSLYCYLQKQASGTIDDIVIQIERKPLTNVGFTVEQGVTVNTSGSFTEVRLRDLQYKKQINYGDLSIREIGYPIDVPLTNVKQVRISAKQSSGQSDDRNKNLIVYGRFIKSSTTTNET